MAKKNKLNKVCNAYLINGNGELVAKLQSKNGTYPSCYSVEYKQDGKFLVGKISYDTKWEKIWQANDYMAVATEYKQDLFNISLNKWN